MTVKRRGALGRERGEDRRSRVPVGDRHSGFQLSEIQRLRLLAAAVGAVEQCGYNDASVARITERAGVSRRTFYELFENREECLLAALQSTLDRIASEVAEAGLADRPWVERVRGGLWVILCFFDREPALARLCLVESQRAGQLVLERRQEVIGGLARLIDEGRQQGSRSDNAVALTAQGIVGAVLSILYARLLEGRPEPLRNLSGQLMGMIVLPYLGTGAARREQARATPVPVAKIGSGELAGAGASGHLASLPMRLTYRTAKVLQVIAAHPACSNRQAADLVGIVDQGQISKLLARLQRLGLVENAAHGAHDKGEPNQWVLTQAGRQVACSIHVHPGSADSWQAA